MGKHGFLCCFFKSLDLMEKELCELCRCLKKSTKKETCQESDTCYRPPHHSCSCQHEENTQDQFGCLKEMCKCKQKSCHQDLC